MSEQEHNIVHQDVSIGFEKAKRMLFGQSVACEQCGLDADEVDGYEYHKTGKRVLLCRHCAEKNHFCFGCHRRYKDIAEHLAICTDAQNQKDEDRWEERHESVLSYVEDHAVQLRGGHRAGDLLATAVIRAYKAYVYDDRYDDADLDTLEAAITAYRDAP